MGCDSSSAPAPTSNDDEAKEDIKIVLAAPGVRPADLSVSIIGSEMSVKGETHKHGETFAINRKIAVPRLADAESAQVTASDGMITITMRHKKRQHVPIRVEATPAKIDSDASETKAAAEASASFSEEWVPLANEE